MTLYHRDDEPIFMIVCFNGSLHVKKIAVKVRLDYVGKSIRFFGCFKQFYDGKLYKESYLRILTQLCW